MYDFVSRRVDLPDSQPGTPAQFLREHVFEHRPCLVRGGATRWPALSLWRDDRYLRELTGHVTIDRFVAARDGFRFNYTSPKRAVTLDAFLSVYRQRPDLYLIDVDLPDELRSDIGEHTILRGFLALEDYHQRTAFYVGAGGQLTELHYEYEDLVHVVIDGEKQFYLFDTTEFPRLYPEKNPAGPDFSRLDVARPELCPDAKHAVLYHARLRAGDLLYLPCYWWHGVRSHGRNMALSYKRADRRCQLRAFCKLLASGVFPDDGRSLASRSGSYLLETFYRGEQGNFRSRQIGMAKFELYGKTCLITGATSGVGKHTALRLARAGAQVVLGCRTAARGEQARHEIRERGGGVVELLAADLARLSEVREAASQIVARYDRLHLLINNAGVYHPGRRRALTHDGLEATFAINHLAHFLLTDQLRDLLVASAPARVITVSSEGYRDVALDFTDLQGLRDHDGDRAYDRSKLANVLFTQELARRLAGTRVTAVCLHPGEFFTSLFRHCRWFKRFALRWSSRAPDRGSELMMRLATDPALQRFSGTYHVDDAVEDLADRDPESALRLWRLSEEFTRLAVTRPTQATGRGEPARARGADRWQER